MKLVIKRGLCTVLSLCLFAGNALSETVRVKLTKNINIRRADGTYLQIVDTLPAGSIVELTIDSFKGAGKMNYKAVDARMLEADFVQGVKVVSAPGFDEKRMEKINKHAADRGLYMAKQYIGGARIVEKNVQSVTVETNQPVPVTTPTEPPAETPAVVEQPAPAPVLEIPPVEQVRKPEPAPATPPPRTEIPAETGPIRSFGAPNGKDGSVFVMYREPVAASGRCLAPVSSAKEAREILSRNKVTIGASATEKQMIAVAVGIQQIELLAGTACSHVRNAKFNFNTGRRRSNQGISAPGINMGNNHTPGNVVHLMHELGHLVGNKGMYGPYKSAVRPCHFTGYSARGGRNEEFAEVFAAFIAHPEMLKNSRQKNCRDAYAFLLKNFAKQNKRYAVCNREVLTAAVKSSLGRNTRVASAEPREENQQTTIR